MLDGGAVFGESVDCFGQGEEGLGDGSTDQALLLLTSTGLGKFDRTGKFLWNSNLTLGLRELVLRLPDSAWPRSDGSAIKSKARSKGRTGDGSGADGNLYQDLDVVVLDDACVLKESFWNPAPEQAANSYLLTYSKANITDGLKVAQHYFGRGLDQGWCVDYTSDQPGYLPWLGFNKARIRHLSIWDRLSDVASKRYAFQVQVHGDLDESLGALPHDKQAVEDVQAQLQEADVIVANGGNPDFLNFVLGVFAPQLAEQIRDRVLAGEVVFVGQSAGSMVGAADVGLTYEPKPALLQELLHGQTSSVLSLAGRCAIRPHVTGDQWDLVSALYGLANDLNVVGIPNNEALLCISRSCHMVGETGRLSPSVFSGRSDPQLQRLAAPFKKRPALWPDSNRNASQSRPAFGSR